MGKRNERSHYKIVNGKLTEKNLLTQNMKH